MDRARSPHEVVEELRGRIYGRDQQMIAGTSAGDIQELPLGRVHFVQVRAIRDAHNA